MRGHCVCCRKPLRFSNVDRRKWQTSFLYSIMFQYCGKFLLWDMDKFTCMSRAFVRTLVKSLSARNRCRSFRRKFPWIRDLHRNRCKILSIKWEQFELQRSLFCSKTGNVQCKPEYTQFPHARLLCLGVLSDRVSLQIDFMKMLKNSSPATRHGGAWGKRRYSFYSFSTSALDGVSGQRHAPDAL
jgi:hypothetical protein